MKPITEYKDYREFMQDFYDERKRTGAFSWREFSKLAGFKSPTYLKLVCEGKSSLSLVKMEQAGRAMNLAGYEMDYFKLMVKFMNAEKDSVKKEALLEMQKIAVEHKVRMVDSDTFQYYESWKYPVVRELAPMMPGAKPHEIAEACKDYVSAEEVRDVLNFLVKAGFLKKASDKAYLQTEKTVIGSKEALPIAIRAMHKEMATMAARAVDRYPSGERCVTGVTLSVNDEARQKIINEINSCCMRIASIANECENQDQVYRMNFQFFPMTDKVSKGK